MPDLQHRSKLSIEDLLKLKRAERPAADFWNKFEQELRQKQLTALMERRAWWQDLPQFFSQRAYVPVGAAAILAFTYVSVRYSQSVDHMSDVPAVATATPVVMADFVPVLTQSHAPVPSSPVVNRREHSELSVDDRVAISARNNSTTREVSESPVVAASVREVLTPSARSIAANLAQLEQSEPELVNSVMGSRLSTPVRTVSNTGAVVEFASLSSSSSRRNRLLAQYGDHQVSPVASAPDVVRERLTRRLNDLDYGDRFSRVGLKGDQVSLRF